MNGWAYTRLRLRSPRYRNFGKASVAQFVTILMTFTATRFRSVARRPGWDRFVEGDTRVP
jgi:hypothetical protein